MSIKNLNEMIEDLYEVGVHVSQDYDSITRISTPEKLLFQIPSSEAYPAIRILWELLC